MRECALRGLGLDLRDLGRVVNARAQAKAQFIALSVALVDELQTRRLGDLVGVVPASSVVSALNAGQLDELWRLGGLL